MERPTKEQVEWALGHADQHSNPRCVQRVLAAEVRALREDLEASRRNECKCWGQP